MTIDYSKFTNKSRNAVAKAVALTKQCQYHAVEPQVLMVAVLQEGNDMVPFMLSHMGTDKMGFLSAVSDTIQQFRREYRTDDVFDDVLFKLFMRHKLVVLCGYNHGVDVHGFVVLVFNGDLRFSVRTQIRHGLVLSNLRKLL